MFTARRSATRSISIGCSALGQTRARVAELVGRRFVGDSASGRLWFDGYWLEPLISSAYREARGEPIVEGS